MVFQRMPRQARIDAPGALHHIIVRGIEKKKIFRYIHLNPLRAGLVEDMQSLDNYPWTGHRDVMGKGPHGWQNADYILALFADSKKLARKRYRSFVEEGISAGNRPDLIGGGLLRSAGGWLGLKEFRHAGIRLKGDERILGDSEFTETVLKENEEQLERKYRLQAEGYDFERVVGRVAEVLCMAPAEIVSRGKSPKTVRGRSLLCYWANRELGLTTIEIANRLHLCQSAVSRASARGEKLAQENNFTLVKQKSIKS